MAGPGICHGVDLVAPLMDRHSMYRLRQRERTGTPGSTNGGYIFPGSSGNFPVRPRDTRNKCHYKLSKATGGREYQVRM